MDLYKCDGCHLSHIGEEKHLRATGAGYLGERIKV